MKTILSVAGVLALTVGAWALETGVTSSSETIRTNDLFQRISELRQDCDIQNQENLDVQKQSRAGSDKNAGVAKGGRDPLPAERLGLMLKLSSL